MSQSISERHAFPCTNEDGLTKRELYAALAMASMAGNQERMNFISRLSVESNGNTAAQKASLLAVEYADCLIAALENGS